MALDELNLMVHPLVAGRGDRLFLDGTDQTPLRLTHCQTFGSGVVHVTYQA